MSRITDRRPGDEPMTDRQWLEALAADLEHRNAHNESLDNGDVRYICGRLRQIAARMGAEVTHTYSSVEEIFAGVDMRDYSDGMVVADGGPPDATIAPNVVTQNTAPATPTAEEDASGQKAQQTDAGDAGEDAADRPPRHRRQDN